MSTKYYVVGPCKVAGVAPGGTVTREQVEAWAGDGGTINFDALVGVHLEEVGAASSDDVTAKAPKGGGKS